MAALIAEPLPSASVQADFYAKLSRLQDDLLAKRHPRIRLPSPALQELQRLSSISDGANAPISVSSTNGDQPTKSVPINANTPASSASFSGGQNISSAAALEFEQAEQERRTKRRRVIENRFRQGCEAQKKRMALENLYRKKDPNCIYYDEPHNFDTAAVLEQALQIVKPISGSAPPRSEGHDSPASSFDENEYYSSQVNSPVSKSEGEVSSPHTAIPLGPRAQYTSRAASRNNNNNSQRTRDVALNTPNGNELSPTLKAATPMALFTPLDIDEEITELAEMSTAGSSKSRDESYSPPAPDAFRQHPVPSSFGHLMTPGVNQFAPPAPYTFRADEPENDTDESYSPPAPTFPSVPHANESTHQTNKSKGRSEAPASARSKTKEQRKEERLKKKEERKARKEGTGQANPQRMSKSQRKDRDETMAQAAQAAQMVLSQSQGAIGVSSQITNPRKRRRDAAPDHSEPSRQVSGAKRVARDRDIASPMPYIKPEPQSPPPFANLPPSNEPPRELRFREDGLTELVEIDTPNRALAQQRRHDGPRQIQYVSDDDMISPRYVDRGHPLYAERHMRTPTLARRPTYEGDLRRVASYQHAMRPTSPEMAPPPPRFQRTSEDVRYVRAPSRIVSERPASGYAPYYEEDVQQISAYRPVQRREHVYYDMEDPPLSASSADRHAVQMSSTMGAPQVARQRVYRDEFGEEWIAIPAPRRQLFAPDSLLENRTALRYVQDGQPMYETRQPTRQLCMAPQYSRQAAPAQYSDVYPIGAPSRAYSTRPTAASQSNYGEDVYEARPRAGRPAW